MVGARGGGISSHAKFYGPCEDYIILKFVSTMNYCWVGFFFGGGRGTLEMQECSQMVQLAERSQKHVKVNETCPTVGDWDFSVSNAS